jgi:hypothetical protein
MWVIARIAMPGNLLDRRPRPTSPTAMAPTALIAAGLMALSFALSFLLPRQARMEAV